mgnify:FL=1
MSELTTTKPGAPASAMTIEGACGAVELHKRTRLPGVTLRGVCPKCGAAFARDMGDHHLSYPKVGEPIEITAYCGECEHEWRLGALVVRLTVEGVGGGDPHDLAEAARLRALLATVADAHEADVLRIARAAGLTHEPPASVDAIVAAIDVLRTLATVPA